MPGEFSAAGGPYDRMKMDFSIVTPSYNMGDYLRKCHASISDQPDVTYEHIVMDGGSTDGTVEWLSAHPEIISKSEKDNGMYDAVKSRIATKQRRFHTPPQLR